MKNLLLPVMAALVIAAGSATLFAADHVLRVAFIGSESHGFYIGLNTYFKPEIEARTGGRVRVELYPNAQLGSDSQAIKSCWKKCGKPESRSTSWTPRKSGY